MKSISACSSLLALLALVGSATAQNTACNITFSRLSQQDGSSIVGSVSHRLTILSYEEGKPDNKLESASCWQTFNWGAGCSWGRAERTSMKEGWAVEHQVYNAFEDFSDDITVYGNGCDGTVLKCKGSHSMYCIPDPNGGTGKCYHISDTKCALNVDDIEFLAEDMSDQLPLPDDLGDSEDEPEEEEEEITCMLFDNLESVCVPFWQCTNEDDSFNEFYDASASLSSTMTAQPTYVPIESPGACNS